MDVAGPLVEQTSFPDGAVDVPVNGRVVVRFDEPLSVFSLDASSPPWVISANGLPGAICCARNAMNPMMMNEINDHRMRNRNQSTPVRRAPFALTAAVIDAVLSLGSRIPPRGHVRPVEFSRQRMGGGGPPSKSNRAAAPRRKRQPAGP